MKKYSDYEVAFIKENYDKMTSKEIAETLGRTKGSIDRYIQRNNIKKSESSGCFWTIEEERFLINNYKSMKNKDISLILNKTLKSIELKAKRLGLKKDKKYFYDYSKFLSITTEEDAYWLGFLYADGYVCITSRSYWFGCDLQASDFEHLEKLNKFMGSNRPIRYFDKICSLSGSISDMCSITFHNKDFVYRLIKLGCTQRKSLTITMPFGKFDNILMRHFIRGYFDDDGSLGDYRKYNYTSLSIESGSEIFLKELSDYIFKEIGVKCYIYSDKTCWKLLVRKQIDVKLFLEYMYKDSNIYLERKYNKYLLSHCLEL